MFAFPVGARIRINAEDLCILKFAYDFIYLFIIITTRLRWLPMVLFSYNRIYRDQTLSARITRGMFVAVLPDREQSSQICELFTLYMNFF